MLRHYMKASRICAYFMMVASLLCLLTGLIYQDNITIIISMIYIGVSILNQTVVLKNDVETVGHRFEEEIPSKILIKARVVNFICALLWAFFILRSSMNHELFEIFSSLSKRPITGSEICLLMMNLILLMFCIFTYFSGVRRQIINKYIRETEPNEFDSRKGDFDVER